MPQREQLLLTISTCPPLLRSCCCHGLLGLLLHSSDNGLLSWHRPDYLNGLTLGCLSSCQLVAWWGSRHLDIHVLARGSLSDLEHLLLASCGSSSSLLLELLLHVVVGSCHHSLLLLLKGLRLHHTRGWLLG